jgi:7,8-dihydropterin-6-yl-methyl-4-(beta-D-ribofuranosyl)aminobenzene 5'-phosphate synthase
MHCSGFEVKVALEQTFGSGCVPAGVGHKIRLEGDREIDDRLLPAHEGPR